MHQGYFFILRANHEGVYLIYDGKFFPTGQLLIHPENRSFRYGDGLFETMKVKKGRLLLSDIHFHRLFHGLQVLGFSVPTSFTPEYLQEIIFELCKKNALLFLARLRLMVFRGEGGLYALQDDTPHFILQAWPIDPFTQQLNKKGLEIGIYPDARKSCDAFSGLKSNNYLPYVMAARYARQQRWDDSLVLNTSGRIAEASIANIFLSRGEQIITPPLTEGCVAGVTREYLLNILRIHHYTVKETPISIEDLAEADELWLTNAGSGLRWVARLGEIRYHRHLATTVYRLLQSQLEKDYPTDP